MHDENLKRINIFDRKFNSIQTREVPFPERQSHPFDSKAEMEKCLREIFLNRYVNHWISVPRLRNIYIPIFNIYSIYLSYLPWQNMFNVFLLLGISTARTQVSVA